MDHTEDSDPDIEMDCEPDTQNSQKGDTQTNTLPFGELVDGESQAFTIPEPKPPVWGLLEWTSQGVSDLTKKNFPITNPDEPFPQERINEIDSKRPIAIHQATFKYGRHPRCNLVAQLDDFLGDSVAYNHVSMYHFELTKENINQANSPAYLKDISTNGTWLNGIRMKRGKQFFLRDGDLITVAHPRMVMFKFINVGTGRPILENAAPELSENYSVISTLGSGSYGTVYRAFSKEERKEMAIKHILKGKAPKGNDGNVRPVEIEADVMVTLKHPCTIQTVEVINGEYALDIVMPLMHGKDLLTRITNGNDRHLTETQSRFFFYQLISAVRYLHENSIVHRDIKPENIFLLNQDEFTLLKLGDYGLAKIIESNDDLKTALGTQRYTPPEIIQLQYGNLPHCSYTPKVDIWSCAVTLYSMISGHLPFPKNAHHKILAAEFGFYGPVWNNLDEVKNLICKMLVVNVKDRYSLDQILGHPWLWSNRPGVSEAVELIKAHSAAEED